MREKKALCEKSKILSSQQQLRNTVMRENTFIINTAKKNAVITVILRDTNN